mmetsp:Transcript_1539/g.1373  ORF Transcript_1539/g.1373 Transcript_1539/m.1373 type:complete len:96 (-) Transcript_1539:62-349(-)
MAPRKRKVEEIEEEPEEEENDEVQEDDENSDNNSDNNSVDNTDITLIEWINYFPVIDSEEVVHSVCVGDITIGLSAGKNDNTYCSSSVYPKILTV